MATGESYDVIVAGLGVMGSAAVDQLASRGAKVLGLDRFRPPHDKGSSHGESRIIREAYWEHPSYVPLIHRAYELWAETERRAGVPLYLKTGALLMGVPDGDMIPGARRTAREHRLAHENHTAAEVRAKWPLFRPSDDMEALFEPRAGALFPERCIQAQLDLAARGGAALRYDEPLLDWTSTRSGVTVRTARGEYHANRLVLAAGAWMPKLLSDAGIRLWVERQVFYWFRPQAPVERFAPDRFPIYAFEGAKDRLWYGFPDLGNGIKTGVHHQGEEADADVPRRAPDAAEEASFRRLLRAHLPDVDGTLLRSQTCMYTNTADMHFLIDWHPRDDNVVVASPCGGHGFKYGSVVGEILADLALDGRSRHDISFFGLGRLQRAA